MTTAKEIDYYTKQLDFKFSNMTRSYRNISVRVYKISVIYFMYFK